MSKKQEVCEQWNFDAMIKTQPSEKAKAWFRRKPYDIKRKSTLFTSVSFFSIDIFRQA